MDNTILEVSQINNYLKLHCLFISLIVKKVLITNHIRYKYRKNKN